MRTYLLLFLFLVLSLPGLGQLQLKADSNKISLLNTENQAEAFPFISADGLRLYFTSGKEGLGRVYFSERKLLNLPFTDARPLSKNLPDSFFAATLTADELEIYLFDAWRPYYSRRASKDEDFQFPRLIAELGDCHQHPSISPSGEELIAIHGSGCDSSRKSRDTVRLFSKSLSGYFQKTGTLAYPAGFDPGPGQFTKDGLSFIMTVSKRWYDYDRAWVDSTIILKYDRKALQSPFKGYSIILKNLDKKPEQITLDAQKKIMIAVLNTKTWGVEVEQPFILQYRINKL